MAGEDDSEILPPHEGPLTQTTLRIPEGLMRRIDWAASQSNYTRSEVVTHALRWACVQLEKRFGAPPPEFVTETTKKAPKRASKSPKQTKK